VSRGYLFIFSDGRNAQDYFFLFNQFGLQDFFLIHFLAINSLLLFLCLRLLFADAVRQL